jgi:uncharacterized protein
VKGLGLLQDTADRSAKYQGLLGLYYLGGLFVDKDVNEGLKRIRKAISQGDVDAPYYLGIAYKHGEGVAKDPETAAMWFTKAAELGQADAQSELGRMYEEGIGVAKDAEKSRKWFEEARKRGVDKRGLPVSLSSPP